MKKINCFWLIVVCVGSSFVASQQVFSEEELPSYEEQVKALSEKGPGTYPITFYYDHEGERLKKISYLTITGNNTVVNDNGDAIDANPIELTVSEARNYTAEDWVAKAKVKAWNVSDGLPKEIVEVDVSKLKGEEGNYPITFKSDQKAQITVTVTLISDVKTTSSGQIIKTKDFTSELVDWKNISWLNKMILTTFLIMILFIPLIALFIQYIFAKKLVKRILSSLTNHKLSTKDTKSYKKVAKKV